MGEYIQYDSSSLIISGENIVEAVQSDKKLMFNESYTVIGSQLKSPSLYACYDLIVMGNLAIDEVEIKGKLTVLGNIKSKKISCLKEIVCDGNIDADTIFAGADLIAGNIVCKQLSCSGNVFVKTTIDIGTSIRVDNSVMAGEGIVGGGLFESKNAVAAEYFEFEGDVNCKVVELETDATFGTTFGQNETDASGYSLEELVPIIKRKLAEGLTQSGNVNENGLLQQVKNISAYDEREFTDWYTLTKYLIEISYLNEISNLRDYLILLMSNRVLPPEILSYETLEHIFSTMFPCNAEQVNNMEFKAVSVEDLVISLKIALKYHEDIPVDSERILDKIFQSIGIKYKTVKTFFKE